MGYRDEVERKGHLGGVPPHLTLADLSVRPGGTTGPTTPRPASSPPTTGHRPTTTETTVLPLIVVDVTAGALVNRSGSRTLLVRSGRPADGRDEDSTEGISRDDNRNQRPVRALW